MKGCKHSLVMLRSKGLCGPFFQRTAAGLLAKGAADVRFAGEVVTEQSATTVVNNGEPVVHDGDTAVHGARTNVDRTKG